jgi:hypothetical protein
MEKISQLVLENKFQPNTFSSQIATTPTEFNFSISFSFS